MRHVLVCLLILGGPSLWAQDKPQTEKLPTPEGGKLQPLPKGQTKVYKAIVMDVKGVAQARPAPKTAWKALKVNDVLSPGAVIRTGRKSHVALRVGPNASMLVERQSRVKIPEIIQDGEVLRTRVSMNFGKVDVRVDQIGLRNDFGVATPTATLAVRGTTFTITWDAVNGFKARGHKGNKLYAIEATYIEGVTVLLSADDLTSEENTLPALASFVQTYVKPLVGAIGAEEGTNIGQGGTDTIENPTRETGLNAAQRSQGSKQPRATGSPPSQGQEKR